MTDAHKRLYVSNLYKGPGWKSRVEKMPMDQITAIYLKHIQAGTLPTHLDSDEQEHLDIPPQPPHQNEDEFPSY